VNIISADLKKNSIIILLRNLPKDTIEEHLSAFLWQRLGWNIAPEQLSVKNLEPPFDSANCLAVVTRASLSDFFSRALEGIAFDGRMLQVAQKTKPNDES
jgi:hypothetical protein